MTHSADMINS